MRSFSDLLQSKQIDEQNSTSAGEELSEMGQEDAMKPLGYPDFTAAAKTLQVICRGVAIFGALVTLSTTLATIEAILSTEAAFPSDVQPTHQHLLAAFRSAFTWFMASVILLLLAQYLTTVMCYIHGLCSWTLRLYTRLALIGLTGDFAIRSSRSLTTSIWFPASVVVVPLSTGLQVLSFLRKPLENWDRHSQGTLQKCSKHWDTDESEYHKGPALSDPQETAETGQLHQTSRVALLLLLGILAAASIPYHAGLQAPDGFWQPNATDGLHHYHARAGDTIIPQTTYPEIFEDLYYNATATIIRSRSTCASLVAMGPDLHGLFRVYATDSCSSIKSSNVRTFSLLQENEVPEWNWTIEREALSQNDKEDAIRALAYQASKYETSTVDIDTYVKIWSDNVGHCAIAFSASVVAICLFTSVVIIVIILNNKSSRYSGIHQACKYYEWQEALTGQGAFEMVYAAGNCSESADDPAVDDEDNHVNRRTKHSPREANFRVSCAAPNHMTGNQSLLLTGGYMPVLDSNDGEEVLVNLAANGEAVPLRVDGSGSVRTENIALDDVWYVPGLDSNLVSTGQLARQGCAVSLGAGGCRITRGGGALVGTARFTEEGQFELDFLKVAA